MANYRGHVTGAIVFALLYLAFINFVFSIDILPTDREIFSGYAFPVALVGITVLFGLFPDIDINSHAQNLFYTFFFIVDVGLIISKNYQEAAYLGLIAMLPVIAKHRGWTHSKLATVIVPLPLLVLPALNNPDAILSGMPYYGAAVAGYVSHLFFDGLLTHRRRKSWWR